MVPFGDAKAVERQASLPAVKITRVMSHNAEVCIPNCMLAILALVWAGVLVWPGPVLEQFFAGESKVVVMGLAAAMTVQGIMLLIGSCKPIRILRQCALAFGAVMWFVNFGIFLDFWQFTLLLVLVAVLGLFNLTMLGVDVTRKPRECLNG